MVHGAGKSPAQVVLRFALQENVALLVGTANDRHLEQDAALQDFALLDEEMEAIRSTVMIMFNVWYCVCKYTGILSKCCDDHAKCTVSCMQHYQYIE